MTLAEVTARLSKARNNLALCPAHDDSSPSLSVSQGRDGRVLLHCFAGCDLESVCSAIGIQPRDLFNDSCRPAQRREVAQYIYRDENDVDLYRVIRFDPKDFRQRRADGVWAMEGVRRVLYCLPELIEAIALGKTIYIPEGEKAVDALRHCGVDATCSPGGAGKWREEYLEHLRGAAVVILPDNDAPGRRHADQVAHALNGVAASVKVLALPGLLEKADAYDWLAAGGSAINLEQLVNAALPWRPGDVTPKGDEEQQSHGGRKTPSTRLLELVADRTLFNTADGEQYMTSENGDHLPIRSRRTREEMSRLFAEEYGKAVGSAVLADVINVLAGRASQAETHTIYRRVAVASDGRTIIDLGDATRRVIAVSAAAPCDRLLRPHWEVCACPPDVRFYRPAGMLALPIPERGGNIAELRQFINVAAEGGFTLAVSWLLSTFVVQSSRPLLAIGGEQGSAKSTAARSLVSLIDPSSAPLRSPPRDEHSLAVAARHTWVLAIDNLSYISNAISDALCRMATGGAWTARSLYTDFDEVRLEMQRSVIITSIEPVITRGDLFDRTISVQLSPIPESARRDEETLNAEFAGAAPRILGSLLDAISVGLAELPSTRLASMPRLADFARWVSACEGGLGWERGRFMAAYAANGIASAEQAIDADTVAMAVKELVDASGNTFSGSAAAWLANLADAVNDDVRRERDWPKTARAFSGRIDRAAPALRRLGYSVERRRDSRGRSIVVSRAEDEPTF